MNFLFVYSDDQHEWNSSEWRCVIPAEAIDRHPDHKARLLSIADFAKGSQKSEELCSEADIIIVERSLYGQVLTAIMHWKAEGKAIIANFDDAYHLLPKENFSHDFWLKGISKKKENGEIIERIIDPPPIAQFKWGLRMVDGAIVASKKLVEDWENYTDVRYLPMFLDFRRYQNLPEKQTDDIVIGWSGSMSHLHSFSEGILDALESVCRARPQVKLKIGNDRRIYDRLKVPENQKMLTPWVPYEKWPSVLGSYDIGLAPMEGEFDARRSWVKVLEYMAMKIPWVASNSPAYQGLEEYGQIIENNALVWEQTLLEIIDSIDHYQDFAAKAPYQFAKSQNVDENVEWMINILFELTTNQEKKDDHSSKHQTTPNSPTKISKNIPINPQQKKYRNNVGNFPNQMPAPHKLEYAPETCIIFVSYKRAEIARQSYLSLSKAIYPYRDRIKIIISDATDNDKKINWARETDADDLILTPRFTPAATSRNLAMTLIMDKYTPNYLCMVEDDFEYSQNWYPSLVEAAEKLYGVRSPFNLAYGIFSGCDHHIPEERKIDDEVLGVTAYLFGAVAYQRFMPTKHYLSVMRFWDPDLLGISYAQTGGQTFRNTMRGYCGAILPGDLSRPLDFNSHKSTWSKGKRDPGPPPHSFDISDYKAIFKAASEAGRYTDDKT